MAEKGDVETEVKLEVGDLAAIRARLQDLGARLVRSREFEDNVLFDDERGRMRASGEALRVRSVAGRGVLTFKGPKQISAAGLKTRRELEVGIDDAPRMVEILDALGYEVRFRYQKYRETWRLGGCEIVVDETPIGNFLEIEGIADEIPRIAASLGYDRSAYIDESYAALFVARGGKGHMVFPR